MEDNIKYLHALAKVNESGYVANQEIKECIQSIREGLGLKEISPQVQSSKLLVFRKMYSSLYAELLFHAVVREKDKMIDVVYPKGEDLGAVQLVKMFPNVYFITSHTVELREKHERIIGLDKTTDIQDPNSIVIVDNGIDYGKGYGRVVYLYQTLD